MRFWHGLGYTPIEELEPLARHAEALGFHGVTLGDHWVTAETQVDRYEIAQDGERPWESNAPWPDPWVQFAALAAATERLEFMTTVYILPLRDVFTAAKAISSAAVVTRGRVHLGVGVGWQSLEFSLSGQPFHRRGRHIDEQLQVLAKLWSGEMVDHEATSTNSPASGCCRGRRARSRSTSEAPRPPRSPGPPGTMAGKVLSIRGKRSSPMWPPRGERASRRLGRWTPFA